MALQYGSDEWEQAYKEMISERTASPPPYIYFTPEWVAVYEKTIQEDDAYKEAAKTWEGSVVLHATAEPELGFDDDLYIYMDLWHGECRWAKIIPKEAGEAADFVITGSLERWMQVARKQLDVIKGMMQGKLKLKGDLPTIVRAVKASARLVDLSADVGGTFPDELSAEQLEELRGQLNPLREKIGF